MGVYERKMRRKNRQSKNIDDIEPNLRYHGKTTQVKTARGRKNSSTKWLKRQLNDPYVELARQNGYRSRATFKLIQINEKISFFNPNSSEPQIIVDLGAAPGGWSEWLANQMLGSDNNNLNQIIAVDILDMAPIAGVDFIQGDIRDEQTTQQIIKMAGGQKVTAVISDMAPNSSGQKQLDHLRIMALCESSYELATDILAAGGTFLAKTWQGGSQNDLLKLLKHDFKDVHHIKPDASRKDSAESYVVAMGFKN